MVFDGLLPAEQKRIDRRKHMTNTLTRRIMDDPKPSPPPPDTHSVTWFRPQGRGRPVLTITNKNAVLMSKFLLEALGVEPKGAVHHVRIGLLDTGDLIIERVSDTDPHARRVYSSGQVGGGPALVDQLREAGFGVGRYPAIVNRQGTQAMVRRQAQ